MNLAGTEGTTNEPEEAAAYLSRTNFKSVIEWLTAESILHRPDDPLAFIREVVDNKVSERGDAPYSAEHATRYVQSCYSEAAALADAHGRMTTRSTPCKVATLERLVRFASSIGHLEPRAAFDKLAGEACGLVGADRAAVYTLRTDQTLELRAGEGEAVVEMGRGVVGTVASTRASCNIGDAKDERLDKDARTLLCVPVCDGDKVCGAIEVRDKTDGAFGAQDEAALRQLAALSASSLKHAALARDAARATLRAEALVDLVHKLHEEGTALSPLVFTLTNDLPKIFDCDKCIVLVVDKTEMWALVGDYNYRIGLNDHAIASLSARDQAVFNVNDAYEDDRFNNTCDKQTGYRTRSILSMPVGADPVLAVVQLLNKNAPGAFTDDDQALLAMFLRIVADIMAHLHLTPRRPSLHSMTPLPVDDDANMDALSLATAHPARESETLQPSIVEEGDDDDDDDV